MILPWMASSNDPARLSHVSGGVWEDGRISTFYDPLRAYAHARAHTRMAAIFGSFLPSSRELSGRAKTPTVLRGCDVGRIVEHRPAILPDPP